MSRFERVIAGRKSFVVATLLLAAVGCTLRPGDGEQISHATDEVKFEGFVVSPNDTVRVEAQNSDGAWLEIGRAVSGNTNENKEGATPLFRYETILRVPKASWRAVTVGGKRQYQATLRVRVGNISTYTYTAEGHACILARLQVEKDLAVIGDECATGQTITLVANAMSLRQPDLGRDGWLCSTSGPGCAWQAMIAVDPLGLSGCQNNYTVHARVRNVGDIPWVGDATVELSVTGRGVNYICYESPFPQCGVSPTHPSTRFQNGVALSKRVALTPGQETLVRFSGPLGVHPYTSSATFTATGNPARKNWTYVRTDDSPDPSRVCF